MAFSPSNLERYTQNMRVFSINQLQEIKNRKPVFLKLAHAYLKIKDI